MKILLIHGQPVSVGGKRSYGDLICRKVLEIENNENGSGYDKLLCIGGFNPANRSGNPTGYDMEKILITGGISKDMFIFPGIKNRFRFTPRDTVEEIYMTLNQILPESLPENTVVTIDYITVWHFIPRTIFLWKKNIQKCDNSAFKLGKAVSVWGFGTLRHPQRILGQIPSFIINMCDPTGSEKLAHSYLDKRGKKRQDLN